MKKLEMSIEADDGRREALFSLEEYITNPGLASDRYQVLGQGVVNTSKTNEADITIPITPANFGLFVQRPGSEQYELSYQGSGQIVDILEGRRDFEQNTPHEERRKFALFDTNADFYDRVVLLDLDKQIKHNGHEIVKHTAIIVCHGPREPVTKYMAIDNIRCLSLALPEIK